MQPIRPFPKKEETDSIHASENRNLKKAFKILLKIIASITIAIIGLFLLLLLMMIPHPPKPTVKELENACGVHFPPFQVISKERITGNRDNYTYKIQFKDGLDQKTIDQIEFLCNSGELIYNDVYGDHNPWTKENGIYKFRIDGMFDDMSKSYFPPSGARWFYLTLNPKSNAMTLEYGMFD